MHFSRCQFRASKGAVQGQIHVTEQGEEITAKCANLEIARRNLEVLTAATLEATLLLSPQIDPNPELLAAMVELSAMAYQSYRALVFITQGIDRNAELGESNLIFQRSIKKRFPHIDPPTMFS